MLKRSYGIAYQDNLRLIQFSLYTHDVVRVPRVLVLLQVGVDLGEVDRPGAGELALRYFRNEVVQKLSDKRERRSDGVFVVRDDDA